MPRETIQSLKNQLSLIQRITETISYNLDLADVLSEVVKLVSDTLQADSCLVYLADNNELTLKASKIPHPSMINKVVMQFGEGLTGWAAIEREVIVLEKRAYEDPRFKLVKKLSEDQWEAFVSMPIVYQDKLVGVINVQCKQPRKWKEPEIQLLQTIASQVGGAMKNAKLLTETQTLKEALETRKVIEKAKGLLMKRHAISEDDAYKRIRKTSMDSKKTMKEVAEAMILASSLEA